VLTVERLQQLEERWREVGAPIVANLRSGLTESEIDTLTAPLGLQLPDEARTWWRWHDGVSADVPLRDDRAVGVFWPYQPLAEVVERCLRWREISDQVAAGGEPRWFLSTWLPISSEDPLAILVCDCGSEAGAPTPIRRITPPEGQPPPEPLCASFDELVQRWIAAIDCGLWTYEPPGVEVPP